MSDRSRSLTIIALSFAVTTAIVANAAPLTGSGPNFAIPVPNVDPPREGAVIDNIVDPISFDGTWSSPALSPWHGTFLASGPVPSGNISGPGTTRFDFTPLSAGLLPAGTYFGFGDVDGGSATNETFVLQAFDAGNALITTPWLEEPIAVVGTGTGGGGTILPGNTPGWEWDAGTSTYTIDGSTVTGGNPSLSVILESNTDMAALAVNRTSNFANFGLSAPVPEPGTAAMLVLVGLTALRSRR
jgi:hypothetical protein